MLSVVRMAHQTLELYNDLDRKHEEIKGVLGATASVRESASFDDDGTDPTVDEIMDI